MAALNPVIKKACWSLAAGAVLYGCALVLLMVPTVQRHVLYAHKLNTVFWHDINKPEVFGFARNQVAPFRFPSSDGESIYAWHILPLALYGRHESVLLDEPSGLIQDITKSASFQLLKDDPKARLVIYFHGNAGHVGQGWRTDAYRAFAAAHTTFVHVLAIDYRGYGLSTGTPSEEGLIKDGISTVDWAMNIAKIPSDRIVIIGHSLGTAVSCAVAAHFADKGVDFAGVVLIAGFSNLLDLLTTYAVGGWVPFLSPLGRAPALQSMMMDYLVDAWPSSERLSRYMSTSKKAKLFLIHAADDYEIPWKHSEELFMAAASATIPEIPKDLDAHIRGMKANNTKRGDDGSFVSTFKTKEHKFIRQEVVAVGGHNRVMTYSAVSFAVYRAFELDKEQDVPIV